MATSAGFVTLVGRPNAGKSTLLNRLVGERLAIVSPKPQSTRERVVGILSDETSQIIFLDTPGLLEPRYALHRAMLHSAHKAIEDADVILYLVDATRDKPEDLMALAQLPQAPRAPVLVVFNKLDEVSAVRREELAALAPDGLWVSAATGEGVEALLAAVRARLPQSPFLYDQDDVSTQHLRFFVAEFLRETVLEQLEDEVPYGIAVGIDEFRESEDPVYIRAVLYVERESQKRIVIGAGGSRIKAIGQAARARIEPLVGRPIYLDLWVKELKNWRKDIHALARLGFAMPEEPRR
ncbi:MAG: GTPase Era [Gemmatimonadaceae bacterium]|nr:GTPase Era [Gemmatimonadaceae bacterium]MCW5825077.1 GTPase Era [Gemmatimonadaceae bacterium]